MGNNKTIINMERFETLTGDLNLALKVPITNALSGEKLWFAAQALFLSDQALLKMRRINNNRILQKVKKAFADKGFPVGALASTTNPELIEAGRKILANPRFNGGAGQHQDEGPNPASLDDISDALSEHAEKIISTLQYIEELKEVLIQQGIKPGDLSAEFAEALEGVFERRLGQQVLAKLDREDGP